MASIPSPPRSAQNPLLPPNEPPDSYWRSLHYFNGYRFIVALLLLGIAALFGNSLAFGSMIFELYVYVSAGYVMFSALCFLLIASRRRFHLQLGLQVSADILFIVVLMFASGGIPSGLGLLLLSGLAAAGLISRGRLTLFYAALASIAVLLEQTVQVLFYYGLTADYIQAGLLSIGYFTTAWVAHTLATYLVATEQLAAQREIDLANMAGGNPHVVQGQEEGGRGAAGLIGRACACTRDRSSRKITAPTLRLRPTDTKRAPTLSLSASVLDGSKPATGFLRHASNCCASAGEYSLRFGAWRCRRSGPSISAARTLY